MSLDDFNFEQDLHHAYILTGSFARARDFVDKILTFHNSSLNSPDIFNVNYDVFNIADSRKIRQMQSETALIDSKRFFILGINFITREAQNALLKTLEEPTKNTHIMIVCRSADMLLPTVQSRCQIIKFDSDESILPLKQVEEFVALPLNSQIEYLKKNFDFKSNDSKKDLLAFFEGLEVVLAKELHQDKSLVRVNQIETLLKAKKLLYRSGVPLRLIAEEIAVTLAKK